MPLPANIDTLSISELASLLVEAQDVYHNDPENQIMTDDQFDALKARLEKLDPKNAFFKMVGAPAKGDKPDVTLPYYMGSLDKIRDDPKALDKFKSKWKGSYTVSDKLDGNSGMLFYKQTKTTTTTKHKNGNGKKPATRTVELYSRGNGTIGKNLTAALKYIAHPTPDAVFEAFPDATTVAVRGELIISNANWVGMKGSHPRNVANGAVQAKTPDPEILDKVDFVCYQLVHPKAGEHPSDGLKRLAAIGFKVVRYSVLSEEELTFERLSKMLMESRKDAPYLVDGIVIIHDVEHPIPKGKNPTYGFAMKSILTHDEAEVIVTEVDWTVSKDGLLKPRVHFKGVVIDGATIQKATGFNAAFIEANKVGVGARVVIIRSGAVIPHIVRVTSPAPGGPDMPKIPWEWNDTHVDARLKAKVMTTEGDATDSPQSATFERRLKHFVTSLGLKGVGPGIITRLHENGVKTVKDFMKLTMADILKIDGFKDKSAKTLHDVIQSIKDAEYIDMMVASNLFGRGNGKKRLELILQKFPQIIEEKSLDTAAISEIEGVGPIASKQFSEGLPRFYKFIKDIGWKTTKAPDVANVANIVNIAKIDDAKQGTTLVGQTIVFTGVRDKDLEKVIAANGGRVAGSVSSKTTIVIALTEDCDSVSCKRAREYKAMGNKITITTLAKFKKEYNF